LIARHGSGLTERIVRESNVLCSNGVPSGLTLLDDVGQSLQGIILVGVGEIGCATEDCCQTRAVVGGVKRLMENDGRSEPSDRVRDRRRATKLVSGVFDRRIGVADLSDLSSSVKCRVGREKGSGLFVLFLMLWTASGTEC
jgi:hypothetical protein